MYIGLHVKCPLFLSDFNETCILSTEFRKTLKYQISKKIRPLGAELFHADRRTKHKAKLTVAFGNFAKVPKNWQRL
jgi:hypothetical protein